MQESRSFRLERTNSNMSKIFGGSKSLRLPRSDSHLSVKVVGRSNSSRLFLESVPAVCARATIYERLYSDEPRPRRRAGVWTLLRRAFSRNDGGEGAAKEKKRRPSWMPDPERRWPVQGW